MHEARWSNNARSDPLFVTIMKNLSCSPPKVVLSLLTCLALSFSMVNVVWGAGKALNKPVATYALQCDETFSCPESLIPRVSFWVEVFSRWDTNTAIFHDKDNPHRVYSTLKRKGGCRRSRSGDAIDRERKRLKKELARTAQRISKGQALNGTQKSLEDLFIGLPVSELTRASERVRCQSGNKDRMANALQQFALYRPTILDALERENLTPELQYLPFVESAFNPNALSHVGAAGLWQIMPSTGRTLGLKVNYAVDERYDPDRATYAAAKYFRDSVDKLSETAFENGHAVTPRQLNPFVITSYNYGVRGMQRAIKQVGLSYERLLLEYRSPNFQIAVKNFYASFLAARHVAKNTEVFFPDLPEGEITRIYSYNNETLPRATSAKRLVAELGLNKDQFKKLNPAFKKVIWQDRALIPKGFVIKLPFREQGWEQALANLESLPAEFEKPGFVWHKVRPGESACRIAERYRASCSRLKKLNNLDRKATIYAGKRIKVPTSNGGIGVASAASSSSSSGAVGSGRYRVRRGDSACIIANRHNMRCDEFLALNGLNRRSVLQVGQTVVVSKSNSWHTVKRGQTACSIAESYRVACSALLDANRLSRKSTIYVGQRLRIPTRS